MVRRLQKPFVKFAERQCSRLVETSNLDSLFKIFKRNYKLVPLEVFGKDPYKQSLQATAYRTLISTILSARTRDEVTLEASKRLFRVAPNFKALKSLTEPEIEKLIHPVGFYKTKAKHLKKLANTLSKVPKTREELMKLPGVGRKTANLTLNRAFGIPAIAVDTHVHRICNTLALVKTKTPEQTEKELIKIIPKKYWPEINRLFVSIGRQYTSKRKLEEFL